MSSQPTEPGAPEANQPASIFKDNIVDKIVVAVMIAAAVFVVLAVASGAAARYIFRRDIYGNEELITIAAFWMYFTAAIYAAKTRQHISAEMLATFTGNPYVLYAGTLLQRLLTFGLCLIFTWWGWEFFHWSLTSGGKTNLWQFPVIVGQSSVFVGLIGMLAYFLRDLVMILRTKPSEYRPGKA